MFVVFVDDDLPFILDIVDRDNEDDNLNYAVECFKHHALSLSGNHYPSEIRNKFDYRVLEFNESDVIGKIISLVLHNTQNGHVSKSK